jgi:hypothetical protein
MKQASAIIWEGSSPVDGAPIMAIITGMDGSSINDKTGPMAQVSILRSDVHPVEAIRQQLDVSICGTCPLGPGRKPDAPRVCYVNVGFGPASKFRKSISTGYPRLSPREAGEILARNGVGVRFGDYGDPAMIPFEVWEGLLEGAPFHTGYTHQWKEGYFDSRIFAYVMASVDDENTIGDLRALWGEAPRYYRLAQSLEVLAPREVACPSKNAQGERVRTCAQCKLCNGETLKAKSVVIVENS